MTYPAPYYFSDPAKSAIWKIPDWKKTKGPQGFHTLLIDPAQIKINIDVRPFEKKKGIKNTYSTWDDDFKWMGCS